ncbi:MAG TPA: hypothetical protein EYN67_08445 [Flavobacteriales bacterium]|nr:hypothetical protein [Flavobacteriales bacterium]
MAHFAQIETVDIIDENEVVIGSETIITQVIVIANDDILDDQGNESETLGIQFCQDLVGSNTIWVQTSYNNNMRKNYAGYGFTYDESRDAFISPQPYPSWVLDEDTCQWESPIPYPTDLVEGEVFEWDETSTQWILIEQEN